MGAKKIKKNTSLEWQKWETVSELPVSGNGNSFWTATLLIYNIYIKYYASG